MINEQHLVNDGLQTQSGSCDSNHGTTWTYNQGVVLGGLAELFRATGDRGYLHAQADSAYAFDRNPLDQYGLSWAGPFDRADIARQESAVSLLTAGL
jgi:predicted alpha-1,6-mannanase (GH76 family)